MSDFSYTVLNLSHENIALQRHHPSNILLRHCLLYNLQESLLAVVDDTTAAVDDNDEGDDLDDDCSARPTPAFVQIAADASV